MAGGFGHGTSHSKAPREIAAVVPYRDGRLPDDISISAASDLECGNTKTNIREGGQNIDNVWEPLMSSRTPFFHLDLTSAVRAAESGLDRVAHFDVKKTEGSQDN